MVAGEVKALPDHITHEIWEEVIGYELPGGFVNSFRKHQPPLPKGAMAEFIRIAMGPPHWANCAEIGRAMGLPRVKISNLATYVRRKMRAER